jgi:hypothetical protein
MTTNKLKLNDDKTEALLFSKKTTSVSLPQSVHVGDVDIVFAPSARNLGFMITSDMSLDKHVSTMCKSAYYELRKLSAIRHYLSTHTAVTLVCAFVLSRLDYCNALLSGCPQYLINKLQRVQNSAARLIFQAKKHDHVTPLLHCQYRHTSVMQLLSSGIHCLTVFAMQSLSLLSNVHSRLTCSTNISHQICRAEDIPDSM